MIQNKDQWIIINGIKIKSKNHVVIEDKDTVEDLINVIWNKDEDGERK